MQLLFDFVPLLIFFVAYRVFDIYVATAALMTAMVIVLAYHWLRHRKVSGILIGSTALVLVFGAITLALRNPVFIQWKVTVVNWTVALAFLGTQLFGKQTLTQRTMGHALQLEPAQWRVLNSTWVVTFAAIGAINLFVMYRYTLDTWTTFKVWGQMGIVLITVIGQTVWISRHMPETEPGKSE
jgi:intracellular septation protein